MDPYFLFYAMFHELVGSFSEKTSFDKRYIRNAFLHCGSFDELSVNT